MSVLSDDTDVLLLIPPDFFLVPSDSEEESTSYSRNSESLLVSDLISQVNDLEGRICMIEKQSLFNINKMADTGNLQQLKHFGSVDTLNQSSKSYYNSRSLQNTPLKTNTLPSPCRSWRTGFSPTRFRKHIEHQNILKSNEYLNQKERDDQLLKEIHNFFKLRENKSGAQTSNMFEMKSKLITEENDTDGLHLSTAVFNLNKVNDLLKQLEDTQLEIEQKLKIKSLNNGVNEENDINSINSEQVPNDNKQLPDTLTNECNAGNETARRFLNFDSSSRQEKINDVCLENFKADVLALDLDLNAVNSKRESETDELNLEENIDSKVSSDVTDLLSLNNLWGNKKTEEVVVNEDLKTLRQKLQEEKCRRHHLEDLIQKLQFKLLEEQQKIAVAIKVDKEKDDAISKMSDGWHKIVSQWKDLENQKNVLEKRLILEREKFDKEVSAACQTVKRYETELSKALDLAHGYKEKCELSEKERKNMSANAAKEIETLKNELRDTKEKLERERNQVEKMEKVLTGKEDCLSQTKGKLYEMQNQIRELKKNLKEQQTQLELAKLEKEKFTERLKEERNRILGLEQNKKVLLQNNEDLKRKEKALKENLKSASDQVEKIKVELKEFYQDQVEKIVQEKLREFQDQLSTAEKTLQKEIENRERAVTELAVKQVQQIVEKHVVEVNLLEEKHKEEVELWKIKLMGAEEKIVELQKKLDQYSNHKTEIAQKLQSVMETQWQEALKIITASSPQHRKSPVNTCKSNSDGGLTRQNTITISSYGSGDGSSNKNGLPMSDLHDSPSLSPIPESPFCQDGQITFRDQFKTGSEMSYRIDETPQRMEPEKPDALRKYIQMVLERPPGLPVDDSIDKSIDTALLGMEDTCNLLQWQQVLSEKSSHEIVKEKFKKNFSDKDNSSIKSASTKGSNNLI